MKLEDNLRQIKKRIAHLQAKAKWIESQLDPVELEVVEQVVIDDFIPVEVVEAIEQEEEILVQQPRRRGRRKLNETE